MAYRVFDYADQYQKPDSNITADQFYSVPNALANVFQSIHKARELKKQTSDNYKYTIAKGSSENDNIYFEQGSKAVSSLMKEGILKGDSGKVQRAQELADQLETQNNERRLQDEKLRNGENIIAIREKNDPFYNGDVDRERLSDAYFGKDHDSNHLNRGPVLESTLKTIGGADPMTFKMLGADGYLAKYVATFKEKQKERSGQAGKVNTQFDQNAFWLSNGKPGVSDQHSADFLSSDPEGRVSSWVDMKLDHDIQTEVSQLKARGGDAMKPFKGMSDEEIKSFIKTSGNEKYNVINNKSIGSRINEIGRDLLHQAAGGISKVDYNNNKDKVKPWDNQHFATWHAPVELAQTAIGVHRDANGVHLGNEATTSVGTYFGGSIGKDDGKKIVLKTRNPTRINIQTGKVESGNVGLTDLNLDSYIMLPTKKGGGAFQLQGKTVQEQTDYIKKIPLEYFDPNGDVALRPKMQIGLTGYTINKASVVGDKIKSKRKSFADQLAAAKNANDEDKISKLKERMQELDDLSEKFGAMDPNDPQYDPDDLEIAATSHGIQIKDEVIIPANESDIREINGISGGFNLNDTKNHSEEMKAVSSAWEQRAKEAEQAGYGRKKVEHSNQSEKTVKYNGQNYNVKPGKIGMIKPNGDAVMINESQKDLAISKGYKPL